MADIEDHPHSRAPLTARAVLPWLVAVGAVLGLAWNLATGAFAAGGSSTAMQMQIADHERRITKIEATLEDQQTLLYQIDDKLGTIDQRLIDRWGVAGAHPASAGKSQ